MHNAKRPIHSHVLMARDESFGRLASVTKYNSLHVRLETLRQLHGRRAINAHR